MKVNVTKFIIFSVAKTKKFISFKKIEIKTLNIQFFVRSIKVPKINEELV
jgi:hypothetical protein